MKQYAGDCATVCSGSSTQRDEEYEYMGYHLILDCKNCDKAKITDPNNIREFVKTLVEEIDMVAFGEPIIEHFAEHEPKAAGYSLVQLIQTSALMGHFVDSNGDAYIDIFSCKPFELAVAQGVVRRFFSPQHMKVMYLTRQA